MWIALILLALAPAAARAAAPTGASYAGATICAPCHQEIYDRWRETGHARIMVRPLAAEARDIPLPLDVDEADVSWVIGGVRWKALFLDRQGYVMTKDGTGPGRNEFDLAGRRWADYRPGEVVPYDCGPCHTSGYSPEGHQDGLPGIVGTWALDGVQCEACHGPGSVHARTRRAVDIDRGGDGCARCHRVPSPGGIPLDGVFLVPYSEANQLEQGAMRGLSCTVCHDPHRPAAAGVRKRCEDCHGRIAAVFSGSLMAKARVVCVDCHMPRAGRVARGDAESFRGDLRSHLFRIEHHELSPEVIVDGRTYNPGALGVNFVCRQCHDVFESQQWALAYASIVHRLRATTSAKLMAFQAWVAYLGGGLALLAALSGAGARGWIRLRGTPAGLVSVHRHAAWTTFAIFLFEAALCVDIHTPLAELGRLEYLGWFILHPAFGAAGLLLYAGKIHAVRRLRAGWKRAGAAWGVALLVFWAAQVTTIVLASNEIIRY